MLKPMRSLQRKDQHYYSFSGSLTTPPCRESLSWFVLNNPVTVSPAEVQRFSKILSR